MMVFRGSIRNLPARRSFLLIFLGLGAPVTALIATIYAVFNVDWWPFLLIPDLVILIIGMSVWGTILQGNGLVFDDKEMRYWKGFQKGNVLYSDIKKVYQVSLQGRNSTMIIFNEKGYSNPRCYLVGQTFTGDDKIGILKELISRCRKGRFDIIDDAPLELINSDKKELGWTTI